MTLIGVCGDAVERLEVATRAAISNHMGPTYGAHWYLSIQLFKNRYDHERLLKSIDSTQRNALKDYQREAARIERLTQADQQRKKQLLKRRAQESYAREPRLMPGWAMLEELTLGELSHLYQGLAKDIDRKVIGRRLNVPAPLLESWLHTLTSVCKICAHYSRLWNRELGIKPEIPKQRSFSWPEYLRRGTSHTRISVVLAALHHLMQQVSPPYSLARKVGQAIANSQRYRTKL
nr:Abi family protein [Halomonas andesensis]